MENREIQKIEKLELDKKVRALLGLDGEESKTMSPQ